MQTTGLKGARLSPQQERLWAWQRESAAFRVQGAVWLKGMLHEAAWQQALRQVVEEHEILHTLFYCLPGMEVPVQVIGRRLETCCPVIDLQALSPAQQETTIETHFRQLRAEPFDLAHGPLVRALLFRLCTHKHLFLLSIAALCADSTTLPLLLTELSQEYEAALHGQLQARDPLQYTTISAWQQKLLVAESAKTPREFWEKIDLSALRLLRLPFQRAERNAGDEPDLEKYGGFAPQTLTIPVDEPLVGQLQALADRHEVSVAAVLLACWQALLWRLTEQSELLLGIAVDGRPYEELTQAVGPYTRFVPLHLQLEPQWRFQHMLRPVERALQQALQWQLYFSWPPPASQEARAQAFPLTFEYEQWTPPESVDDLQLALAQRWSCSEPFAIKLSALQPGTHLQLAVHYDSRKVTPVIARRLALTLTTMLLAIGKQPEMAIDTLPLLPSEEQEHLLSISQGPARPMPPIAFQQLFEAQARQYAEQLAVLSTDVWLTYQQLNEQANQLARLLQRQGVGPNVLVGLCVERSAQMILGLLAILKAGGAYVPLDPESPAERLRYQLHDSKAALLLTQQRLLERLPSWAGSTVCLEELRQESRLEPESNLIVEYHPEDLSYVIYTSGSTGVPKGVAIAQQSVVNYTLAMCELLGSEAGWQYTTVSTLAADLGNTAIFCALASGGCIQVLDYETLTSPPRFAQWVQQHPPDVLKIVPSHLSALLSEQEVGRAVLPRRALVSGGEVLPVSLIQQVRELGGSCAIYNHYGPTETTVGVLVNVLGRLDDGAWPLYAHTPAIPIGRPLANSTAYILDRRQQVVPVGVTGELYIGGVGLAYGYLGRPEQTAERFVPHLWSRQSGERLYRTGDLARFTEEGTIEFAGRRDNQVKLRGYRIELGEIEAVLRRHPNVRNSVVLLREDTASGQQLVGYIVARKPPAPSSKELGDFLREQLPGYMVPAAFVPLKVLPLTANGKVDRRQLLAVDVNKDNPESVAMNPGGESKALVLPRDETEFQLLQIWEEVLQVKPISILDNFFDLGGHSILAVRLLALIMKQFGQDLTLATLFLHPTIADLAIALRGHSRSENPPALVAIQAQGSRPPFFCVRPSGGIVSNYIGLAHHLGAIQPFYGLQTTGLGLTDDALETLEDLAAHYISAIKTVQPQGPYLLGGWSMGGVVALEMAQQLRKQGHEVALLAVIDSRLANDTLRSRAMEEEIELKDEEFARMMIKNLNITLPEDFPQIPREERVAYVFDLAKKINGIPLDYDLEQVRRVFRIIKKHNHLAHMYVPQSYEHRIDYFVASDSINQPEPVESQDAAEAPVKRDVLGSWRELAKGGVEVHLIPGNHREMIEEPNVQLLAASLRQCIDTICNSISSGTAKSS